MSKKPRKKAQKSSETETVTAIATRAKCSRTLVLRLLRRGLNAAQICQRISENRAREEARAATSKAVGHINGFPGFPPFAESEAKKEHALAELRMLQVAREKGELLPVEPTRAITVTILAFQRDLLWRLPDEAAQELAMRSGEEIAVALRRHIQGVFHASESLFESECRKYGLRLPPEPPPKPRPRELAYYLQYLRDSRSGEVENVERSRQIGSPEWLTLHPSVSFQASFKYSRLKKEWDAAMADLLNRRAEWDLPPEQPVEPEPEEDEAA